ncbi:MAG: hypothetical protein VX436_00485 [Planctomycetota bacterium]|nr:hypothetical protein [Planctomycetota bacterium]
MSQNKTFLSAVMLVASACFVVGCGGGDEPVEQPKPIVRNTPKAKPRPQAKTVEELQISLSVDDRIILDELDAPRDEASRVAILTFIDAMLRVDAATLKSFLSLQDQTQLQAMIDNNLSSYMGGVSMVQLRTGPSPEGRACVLALYEVGLDYQIQVWYYENTGDGFSFEAGPTRPSLVNKLSGDWIVNYFDQREKQIEIANQPDVEASYTMAGETTTSNDDMGSGGEDRPKGPRGPGGPSGPGK